MKRRELTDVTLERKIREPLPVLPDEEDATDALLRSEGLRACSSSTTASGVGVESSSKSASLVTEVGVAISAVAETVVAGCGGGDSEVGTPVFSTSVDAGGGGGGGGGHIMPEGSDTTLFSVLKRPIPRLVSIT